MDKEYREKKEQSQLASILTILVGIWVAVSPIWITMTGGSIASAIITGCIIALAGLVQYFWEEEFPSWVSGVSAVWLFISAFLFGAGTGVKWSNIVSALAVFILSYWDGLEVAQLHQHHPAHGV